MKRNPTGTLAIVALAGLAALAYAATRKKKATGNGKKPTKRLLKFENGGETDVDLPVGGTVQVGWDPTTPWNMVAVPAGVVSAVGASASSVTFQLITALPPGGVETVFVQALDPDGNLMGEHKLNWFGPTGAGLQRLPGGPLGAG